MWRWLSPLLAIALAQPLAAQPMLRYLALGDSYTIGESVPESGRWPVQLAAALRAQGVDVGAPTIVARTGWTTGELSSAMDAADLKAPYDLVSLLNGVNNQYRGLPLADYQREFEALLRRAIELAGDRPERVIVLSIPDWGVTPFAAGRDRARIAGELDAFNEAAHAIAGRHGVAWFDITGISRDPGAHADMLAGDGLHPSASQYAMWAARVAPAAAGLLQPR
jgi:lysophospholipase L1-like esterase